MHSCSATKGLEDNQKIFDGTNVEFSDIEFLTSKYEIRKEIDSKIQPGNRPGLFNIKTGFYNIYDSTGTTGIKHGIKYKLGKKPVVYKPSILENTNAQLGKIMMDYGYFDASVGCDTIRDNRRVELDCDIKLNRRYLIDSVFFIDDTLQISKVMRDLYQIKYLKSGVYYQQADVVRERNEFIEKVHNSGYPYVNSKDVVFYIDTSRKENLVDIHLRFIPTIDSVKYTRHRYGKIYVNPNFSLDEDDPFTTIDMVKYKDYYLLDGYDFLRESALSEAIYIDEGKIYNNSKRVITVDRLLDFGLFKFVNVKSRRNADNTIDQFFNLTTRKMQTLVGELELNNRSGNYLGLLGKVSYKHKNIFGGAEKWDVSLTGGVETQFGDNQSLINTSDIALETSLTLPGVVMPLVSIKTNRNFIPKTYMSLSIGRQHRTEFYTVNSAKAKYGFKWNETETKSSFFTPIDLNWLVIQNTTEKFDSIRNNDPRIDLSFRNTLILGSSYVFTFNKKDKYEPNNQTFFKGTIELAGGLLNLFIDPQNGDSHGKLFGTQFSQYMRFTADARKYLPVGVGSIAARILAGTGYAYGNSNELPYSKQYSIGGSNSLRAYRLRRLGPGTYISTDPDNPDNQFIDQTGDIKLETSVEYRFPIFNFIKGAVFLDAGNVWTFDSKDKPRGNFSFDSFYNQLAVGAGFGMRFDFNFFVFRLDAAFPIRDINANHDFEWVVNKIDLLNGHWRDKNVILNLGIGYPF